MNAQRLTTLPSMLITRSLPGAARNALKNTHVSFAICTVQLLLVSKKSKVSFRRGYAAPAPTASFAGQKNRNVDHQFLFVYMFGNLTIL